MIRGLFIMALSLFSAVAAQASPPPIEELLDATDDALRGQSSHAVIEMQIKTRRYERSMKMEAWSRDTTHTLIRILEPAKDRGMATLKVEDNIWNYLPKVDRTMKVPAGMMSGSWMGSHFSNDDLVKANRLSDHYEARYSALPEEGDDPPVYTIELVARPDAPVVFGRQELEVRADKVPVRARYFDERGELVRTMTWEEVQRIGDRLVPTVMSLVPADRPAEYTRMRYHELTFDADIPDSTFTIQALKR